MSRSIENLARLNSKQPLHSRESLVNTSKSRPHDLKIGSYALPDFLCGRDWMGWVKILSFYIIYYALLGLTAYFGIGYYAGTMPATLPYIQGRMHSPGMQVFPAMITGARQVVGTDKTVGHSPSSEHGHCVTIKRQSGALKADSNEKFYSTAMNSWVENYKDAAKNGNNVTCDSNTPATGAQGAKNCEFYNNYDWIEASCGANFGYDTGEPCFAVSLNKIANWELQGLSSSVKSVENLAGTEIIDGFSGNGDKVHFHCHQFKFPADTYDSTTFSSAIDYEQEGTDFTLEWVGTYNNTLPSYFWPYGGKPRDLNLANFPAYDETKVTGGDKPFVILKIKVNDKSLKAKANFKCHAYADNIQNSYAVKEDGKINFKWRATPGAEDANSYITYNGMFSLAEFSVNYAP